MSITINQETFRPSHPFFLSSPGWLLCKAIESMGNNHIFNKRSEKNFFLQLEQSIAADASYGLVTADILHNSKELTMNVAEDALYFQARFIISEYMFSAIDAMKDEIDSLSKMEKLNFSACVKTLYLQDQKLEAIDTIFKAFRTYENSKYEKAHISHIQSFTFGLYPKIQESIVQTLSQLANSKIRITIKNHRGFKTCLLIFFDNFIFKDVSAGIKCFSTKIGAINYTINEFKTWANKEKSTLIIESFKINT